MELAQKMSSNALLFKEPIYLIEADPLLPAHVKESLLRSAQSEQTRQGSTSVSRLQLNAQIQSLVLLQRNLPIPNSLTQLSSLIPATAPSLADDVTDSALYGPQSSFPLESHLSNSFTVSTLHELTMKREQRLVDRVNARLREIAGMLATPLSPHVRQIIEIERRSLMLLPFQRRVRLELASYSRDYQFFSASRPDARPKKALWERERKMFDAEVRKAEEVVNTVQTHGHQDFLREMMDASKRVLSLSRQSIVAKIAKDIVAWHGKKKVEVEKQREQDRRKRLKMLRTANEEDFKKWVTETKQDHLKKLIEWAEGLYSDIVKKLKGADGEDIPTVVEGGAPGEATSSQAYFEQMHRKQEVVSVQPACLVGGELKGYQIASLQWMVSLYNNNINGILADEMGLGKTIQTISLVAYLREKKNVNGPHLIVVPLSTFENWMQEFTLWLPEARVVRYIGPKDKRRQVQDMFMKPGRFDVCLTTYEYVTRRKDANFLKRTSWEYVIVDEGHRIKNKDCKLVKSLQTFGTRHRLLLTGTPLQNNLHELWALLNFIMPTIFRSVESFDEWFNKPFQGLGEGIAELNEEETVFTIQCLHKVLRPFLLRREKKDVESKLPPRTEYTVWCPLSAMQAAMYENVKNRIVFDGQTGGARKTLASSMVQLRKVCNHPFLFFPDSYDTTMPNYKPQFIVGASGKFQMLDNILRKLKATGHKVLLFAQWSMTLDLIVDLLNYREFHDQYLRLDGSTLGEERARSIRAFNDRSSPYFLFIMTTKAGGLGLNLQSADSVILFDLDWNPQNDMQAIARAHRIGQTRPVKVYTLLTTTQFEEKLSRATARKLQSERLVAAGGFNRLSQNRNEAVLRQELLSIFNAEAKVFTDQNITQVEELNEMMHRSSDEVAKFRELDDEEPMVGLLKQSDVPQWLLKTEAQVLEEMSGSHNADNFGRGLRVRDERHYNYELITDKEFVEAMEGGNADMQSLLSAKKRSMMEKGKEPKDVPKVKGRRGRPPKKRVIEEDVEGEDALEADLLAGDLEAAGAADETKSRAGSERLSSSADTESVAAKLKVVFLQLIAKTDKGRRLAASFEKDLSVVLERIDALEYSSAKQFQENVVDILHQVASASPEASVQKDAVFLENYVDNALEHEFPDMDEDKPESEDSDDDDEEEEDDDDDDSVRGPPRKRGRPKRGGSGGRGAKRGRKKY
eukprot:ANDGO_00271.mRNA.1 putative ATP-dependent DNA helicase CHR23